MLPVSWSIPRRYLRLTLYDGRASLRERKVLSSLTEFYKVSGDISATVSGAAAEANITISNLKRDTMAFLSTNFTTWTKNQIQNEVELDIGYDNNHALLFRGAIIEAVPSMVSETYTIKLKCQAQFPNQLNQVFSVSSAGTATVKALAEKIAANYGYSANVSTGAATETVKNYSLSQQPLVNHLRYLSEITGLDCFVQNDTVIVKKRNEAIRRPRIYRIDGSNMIGSPRPTNAGAVVKVRLDPTIRTGIEARIKSEKFPTLNDGEYIIETISTSFDTRGNDWFNEIKLTRKDIYTQ